MAGSKKSTRSPSPDTDSGTEPPDSDSDIESVSNRNSDSEPTADSGSSVAPDDLMLTMGFPARQIQKTLEQELPNCTVPPEASVCLARVLAYLSTEILELSANIARNRSDKQTGVIKVTLGDILEALESDPELKELSEKVKMARKEI